MNKDTATSGTYDSQNKHVKFEDEDEKQSNGSKTIARRKDKNDDHIYFIPDFQTDKKKALTQLWTVSAICILFMAVEVIGGYIANSLAIMTDAAHMFSDVSGFFISIFSITLSSLPSDKKMSYGYHRAEVIGALTSVQLIWGLTIWLLIEAINRIINPPEVQAEIMLVISVFGLIFNLSMMKILHSGPGHSHAGHHHGGHGHDHGDHGHDHGDHGHDHGGEHKHDHGGEHKHDHGAHGHDHDNGEHGHDHGHDHEVNEAEKEQQNINIRAAFIHVIGDTIQSVGVILAAVIIYFGGQKYALADPICTFLFSILVIFTTIPIAKQCVTVLMEGVPINIDVDKFKESLTKVDGVISVHDLHIWSISEGRFALSAHIISKSPQITLVKATELCKNNKIYHSTLQVENPDDANYNADKCQSANIC